MTQKIKRFLQVGITSLFIAVPGLVPLLATGTVSAADLDDTAGTSVASGLCEGINTATNSTTTTGNGCTTTGTSTKGSIESLARTVINIFSIIVGVTAVLMIIYGGFRYVTSGGASDKVGNAKNTLIYAIIGLIIVALAQAIVHFVLNEATSNSVS
jgi:hypothetical protein